MDSTQISQMHTMLQHKSIIPVAASIAFTAVGQTSAMLSVSGYTILEQTVSAGSCPLKILDFGSNKLVTSRGMVSSTIFTTCPRSSTTYIRV
jgi:spore coat protein U-like protein